MTVFLETAVGFVEASSAFELGYCRKHKLGLLPLFSTWLLKFRVRIVCIPTAYVIVSVPLYSAVNQGQQYDKAVR
jgi:hypothetical protein